MKVDLTSLRTLGPVRGNIRAISAFSFFHLFERDGQLELAIRLSTLLSRVKGSIIFGSHVAGEKMGDVPRGNGVEGSTRFVWASFLVFFLLAFSSGWSVISISLRCSQPLCGGVESRGKGESWYRWTQCRHSPESWKDLWEVCVFPNSRSMGKDGEDQGVRVKVMADFMVGEEGRMRSDSTRVMTWSVTVLWSSVMWSTVKLCIVFIVCRHANSHFPSPLLKVYSDVWKFTLWVKFCILKFWLHLNRVQ